MNNKLIKASDGNFYGTTSQGGTNNLGTIFKLTPGPAGKVTTVFNFSSDTGSVPLDGLVQDANGNFYCTTSAGGSQSDGTLFRYPVGTNPPHTFGLDDDLGNSDGVMPDAALLLGNDGDLYGSTPTGGPDGNGTLFQFVPPGGFEDIYAFAPTTGQATYGPINADGIDPLPLVQTSDGTFYGATRKGGPNGGGLLFQFVPGSAPRTIRNFFESDPDANGLTTSEANPTAFILASDGAFYLTSALGGADGFGVVFRVATDGTLTETHPFDSSDGENPNSLIQGLDGNIYGTTATGGDLTFGTIFKLGTVPTITSPSTDTATQGPPYSYQIVASDPPTSYGVQGLPPGLTANMGTGLISGTPKGAGTVTLTLHASNASGKGSAPLVLAIKAAPPVITSATTATATEGKTFSYQITAINSPTSYGVQGLPTGLTVNTKTGVISGTPKGAGKVSLMLNAFNAVGKGSAPLTLTVLAAPPVITSATTATATAGKAFSYQITASNQPTSYGVQGLPAGLTVNSQTGLLAGTPRAAGKFTLTLNAYNSSGKGSATLTLTVAAP